MGVGALGGQLSTDSPPEGGSQGQATAEDLREVRVGSVWRSESPLGTACPPPPPPPTASVAQA